MKYNEPTRFSLGSLLIFGIFTASLVLVLGSSSLFPKGQQDIQRTNSYIGRMFNPNTHVDVKFETKLEGTVWNVKERVPTNAPFGVAEVTIAPHGGGNFIAYPAYFSPEMKIRQGDGVEVLWYRSRDIDTTNHVAFISRITH